MSASRGTFHLTLLLLISGARLLSAVRLRGLESPIESGSDVIIRCDGSSSDVEYLSSIYIYGKLPGQAEIRLINVVGTLAGVRKDWGTYAPASFRQRASFTANMTQERAFIELRIRNVTCSDSGMMFRCKVVGVGVTASSVATRLRVQAQFSHLYIDGGEFDCDSLVSQSVRTRIGCTACDRAATRGKSTSFSCWGEVDANLKNNFSISWYRTTWNDTTEQWVRLPLDGAVSNVDTNDTVQAYSQNDPECQLYTLNSTQEYHLETDESDIEIMCEIAGPTTQGRKILANNTIQICGVDPEDVPMNVLVWPQSIVADIGNSTVFLCKAAGDPPITYEWFKMVGNSKVAIGGRKSDPGLLQIGAVTKDEIGTYICLAKDMYRSKEVSVELQYPELPVIDLPDQFIVLPGVSIDLTCEVRASGRVDTLEWPVKTTAEGQSRYSLSKTRDVLLRGRNATGTLVIGTDQTDIRASGNYSCQTTIHGITYYQTTYIRVEGGVEIQDYSPRSATRLFLGSRPSLECDVSGIPEPVVTWLFENRTVTSGRDTVITNSRSTQGVFRIVSRLQIVNLTQAMIGNYTCHAENRHNIATVNFTILRKGPPAAPIVTLQRNEDGRYHLMAKVNADDGGDPLSSYKVTYQLFPQGHVHSMTVSARNVIPTITVPANNDGKLRLVNGGYSNRGRVEIYYRGRWGTVCNRGFDRRDALVVCRQLGYTGAKSFGARFGYGTGPIHVDNINCRGTEARLSDCSTSIGALWMHGKCRHADDVGVDCDPRRHLSSETTIQPEKTFTTERIITVDKIVRGHAHYLAVRGYNQYGAGEPAELLVDI